MRIFGDRSTAEIAERTMATLEEVVSKLGAINHHPNEPTRQGADPAYVAGYKRAQQDLTRELSALIAERMQR